MQQGPITAETSGVFTVNWNLLTDQVTAESFITTGIFMFVCLLKTEYTGMLWLMLTYMQIL